MLELVGLTGWMQRIQAGLRSRFSRVLGKRVGRNLPILLNQKKLYVLPTGFGWFTAVVLFICVLGGLNYNNNLALGFAFLFCTVAFLSVHVGHRNLIRLEFTHLLPQQAFAGGELNVAISINPSDGRARTCLNGEFELGAVLEFELPAASTVQFSLPAEKRGWQELPPLTISTQWPFGLFVVWSHVWPEVQALIYPMLEKNPPAFPMAASQTTGKSAQVGDEDLRNIRSYRPGDAPRQIAWRASARSDELRTRELETPASSDIVLDYQDIFGLTHEAKLSRLAAWCVRAAQEKGNFELRLPNLKIPQGEGPAHLLACLKQLALAP